MLRSFQTQEQVKVRQSCLSILSRINNNSRSLLPHKSQINSTLELSLRTIQYQPTRMKSKRKRVPWEAVELQGIYKMQIKCSKKVSPLDQVRFSKIKWLEDQAWAHLLNSRVSTMENRAITSFLHRTYRLSCSARDLVVVWAPLRTSTLTESTLITLEGEQTQIPLFL